MSFSAIENEFRKKVCEQVSLFQEGVDRYRVLSPFILPDGDHLSIVLKREGVHWILSDEGETFMHLSFSMDSKSLNKGNRRKIINSALSAFDIEDRQGELICHIPDTQYGDALYSFIQALLHISDVSYLSKESVRSTFLDDFNQFFSSIVPSDRLSFDWYDKRTDPEGIYTVDCRIEARNKPLFVYALMGDDRVLNSTISLYHFKEMGISNYSIGVFQDQRDIARKPLAKFTDVVNKQFSSLEGNKAAIGEYLHELGVQVERVH
jgi:hypothetical protein